MAPPTPTIEELLAQINNNVVAIREHLKASGQAQPSYDPAALPVFSLPAQLEEDRQNAIEHLEHLAALLRGPLPYFMDMSGPKIFIVAAMDVISRFEVASKLGADEKVEYDELAKRCGIETDTLKRLLRVAIANRIFQEPSPGIIQHNAVSRVLLEQPVFNTWIKVVNQEMYPSALASADALKKWPVAGDEKQTAWALANGEVGGFFEVLSKDPQRMQRFQESTTIIQSSPVLAVDHIANNFDWRSDNPQTIVDVGGSHGPVSAALLRKNPKATAISQDLPDVIAGATIPDDLEGRLSFKVQDFFQEQQTHGADIYFFRSIFHDWPDSSCIAILQNQVPALKPGARLVLCEVCLPEPGSVRKIDDKMIRGSDWAMQVLFNGKDRDEAAFRKLLERADPRFHLESIKTPPQSMLSIIEVSWKG